MQTRRWNPATLLKSRSVLNILRDYAASMMSMSADASAHSLFPFIPRPLRLLFFILLLVNVRSLPLIWHLRVFRPVITARLQWLWLTLTFASRSRKQSWLDSLSATSQSPFSARTTYRTWASPDECDYNMHLSNSSYAKILDMARCKYSIEHLTPIFREGIWIGLGATHLRFMKEIPIGIKYEVRVGIAAWDEKWVYVVSHFVSKKPNSGTKTKSESSNDSRAPTPSNSAAISGMSTPLISDAANALSSVKIPENVNSRLDEGTETLHAVCINEVVFKYGRRTVPPALILVACGYGMEREAWKKVRSSYYAPVNNRDGSSVSSDTSSGANRSGVKEQNPISVSDPANGIAKHANSNTPTPSSAPSPTSSLPSLLHGAWNDVPKDVRWWEEVLAPYEEERVKRLAIVRDMRLKLESVVRIAP